MSAGQSRLGPQGSNPFCKIWLITVNPKSLDMGIPCEVLRMNNVNKRTRGDTNWSSFRGCIY